jgi:hypothetical protein
MKNILFSLLFAAQACYGFTPPITLGSTSLSLNRCAFAPNDVWSAYNAPCVMAQDSQWRWGLAYSSPFGVDELKTIAVAAQQSRRFQTYGLCLSYTGYAVWNSTVFTAAACQHFDRGRTVGVSIRYSVLDFSESNTVEQRWSLTSSWKLPLSDDLTLFAQLTGISHQTESLRQAQCSMALTHDVNDQTKIGSQLSLALTTRPNVSFFVQQEVRHCLALRAALGLTPFHLSAGVGYRLGKFQLSSSFGRHQQLQLGQAVDVQSL